MCYKAIPNIGDRAAHRYWSISFTINPSGRERALECERRVSLTMSNIIRNNQSASIFMSTSDMTLVNVFCNNLKDVSRIINTFLVTALGG